MRASASSQRDQIKVLDYPAPRASNQREPFDWSEDRPLIENLLGLGAALALSGDLYRRTDYAGGLILASRAAHVRPIPVTDASTLDAIVADRQRVRVIKNGSTKGSTLSSRYLGIALRSEAFLQQFLPVDAVDTRSRYLPDFTLTTPGYNDGGFRHRILHCGNEPWIEPVMDTINRFLDVMAFPSDADRTNAVAAALTVLLRNLWPGGKPCFVVTSSKSHGGKETIVKFAAGNAPHASISYERADWAVEKAFVAAIKHDPMIGLVDVENARLDRGTKEIASAFLERFLTDPEPLLLAPGTGKPCRRSNDIIIAITTNYGSVSEDLLNRGLPIHLEPVGDVAGRTSPIGNPKLEFLPANRDRIEAELRGMIERWKQEGQPQDTQVKHPFSSWAACVGGMLLVNGFGSFLANYTQTKTADDPLRRALGLLGAARPDTWLRSADWAELTRSLGLVKAIIAEADRGNDVGHERGAGVVLSSHQKETFHVQTEDEQLVLKLEKARRRFDAGDEPHTRYRFQVLSRHLIPADEAEPRHFDQSGRTDVNEPANEVASS